MKKISIFLSLFLFIAYINAQSYTGTIVPTTPAPGNTITINFSLTAGTPVTNLVIYAYNSSTLAYTMLPTVSTFNGNAYYSSYFIPITTPNNTLLQFAIGSNSVPITYNGVVESATVLPIIFESYTAVLNTAGNVSLKWKLASTDGMDKSIIYRSTDGSTFTPIATIKGSASQYDYAYTDLIDPAVKSYFYRVACVSLDGDKIISKTLYINNNANGSAAVPKIMNNGNVTGQLFVSGINLSDFKTGEINIYDMLGRKYQPSVLNSNTLIANNLRTGMYYLKIGQNKPLAFMAQ
jgi:hypothetical protein